MKHAKSTVRLGLAALAIFMFGAIAMVSKGPAAVNKDQRLNAEKKYAISGYDPVAYFVDGEPMKGTPNFQVEHDGTTYLFASAENLDQFYGDPEAYIPQYGGYSVYAASKGKVYAANPEVFDIIDGQLYLSRNNKVRDLWIRNPQGYIAQADKAWAELSE